MVNWFLIKLHKQLSRESIIFSINGDGTIEYLGAKKKKKRNWFISFSVFKTDSKWIIHLKVKSESIKFVEEKIGAFIKITSISWKTFLRE